MIHIPAKPTLFVVLVKHNFDNELQILIHWLTLCNYHFFLFCFVDYSL
jgi:hypothetical protein